MPDTAVVGGRSRGVKAGRSLYRWAAAAGPRGTERRVKFEGRRMTGRRGANPWGRWCQAGNCKPQMDANGREWKGRERGVAGGRLGARAGWEARFATESTEGHGKGAATGSWRVSFKSRMNGATTTVVGIPLLAYKVINFLIPTKGR